VSGTIVATIQDLIEVSPPVFTAGQGQQRLALVGPTGVGKTTTLAKIAAAYLSRHSSSIALITIDTYRIAAVEQLKVYGEIMGLPVEVVITPEQLEQAIAGHRDKELILIDTAGRSPRDSFCIEELASFMSPELQIDKHLVLAATTRENELLETIDRFRPLGIGNTIFTKTDECSSLGILLNIQIQNPSPLSYVTNGQRVPEDLLEISPKIVAELIMSQHEGSMHD
jgi:flagellar biosynthesis protein FlhF